MAYDKNTRKLYIDKSSDKGGLALWEIYDCLRYNKRDTRGNRNLGMVIVNGRINIWSAKKPIRSTEPNGLNYEDMKFANFGLEIPIYDSIDAVMTAYGTENAGWTYARPRQSNGEWFRMNDFDGYWHFAPCPFNPFSYPATGTTKIGGHFKAKTTMQAVGGESNEQITIADITDIKDRYYGIYLINNQMTARVRIMTADKTIGENGVEIDVKTDQMPTGEYSVIPFISSVKIEDATLGVTGVKYIPIPNNNVGTITLYDSWYMIVLEAQLSSDNKITYRYQITNVGSGSGTLQNNYMLFRTANNSFDTPLNSYEKQIKLSDITIQVGKTYDSGWSQLPIEVSNEVASNPKVWLSLGNGTEVSFVIPMRSATQQNQ